MLQRLRSRLLTLGAAAAGTALFLALDLPLPVLLGPMFGCLAAALAGGRLEGLGSAGTLMRTYIGVAIGATVTPALVLGLPAQATTLALIPVFVGTIGLFGYPFLRRVVGYDRPTAYYSAMPGGLQDMLIFGEEAGGIVRTMSLIHATRVLTIVAVVPFILAWAYELDLTRAPGAPAASLPPWELALMIACGPVGWKLGERAGLFGASLLGPLILAAALALAGVFTARPPAEMIWAAQFFIGLGVGAKYTGITARELRRDVGAGVVLAAGMAAVSFVFIELAIAVSGQPTLDVWLAFLPGGQAEMVVIAFVAGADAAFVVTHHLVRLFTVILFAPLVARRLR